MQCNWRENKTTRMFVSSASVVLLAKWRVRLLKVRDDVSHSHEVEMTETEKQSHHSRQVR